MTYGRFSALRQALACFLMQDYPNRELVILNDHPVPIVCGEPGVTVYNDEPFTIDETVVPRLRKRLLGLASGDVVCFWDDDDLYFPHHISSSLEKKEALAAPVYKHRRFWHLDVASKRAALACNVAECSFFVDRARLGDPSRLHFAFEETSGWPQDILDSVKSTDLGPRSSYVYQWANGVHHTSGQVKNLSMADCWADFRAHSNDHGSGVILTPDYDEVRRRLQLCKEES